MKKYKKTEEFLVVTVILLSALCVVQLVANSLLNSKKESDVCKSKECVVAAARLITAMDEAQNPCKDFYSYVCAQYVRRTYEQSDHFEESKKLLKVEVRELMEKPNSPTDPEAVKKARLAYKKCLNSTRLIELGVTPLQRFVKALGGWPIAEGSNWLPQQDSFIEDLLAKIETTGYSGKLFDLTLLPDPVQPDVKIITLDQPNDENGYEDFKLRVTRKKRENNDKKSELDVELIKVIASTLSENNNTDVLEDEIENEIEDMTSLNDALAAILSPKITRRNHTRLHNKMSIKQLDNITNQTVNWLSLLQNTFGKENVPDKNKIINVVEVEYIKKMSIILSQYERRVVTNFVMWNIISDLLRYVIIVDNDNEEPTEQNERWEVCLQEISWSMSFAMWRLYADNLLSKQTVKNVKELVSNLKEAYRETIENSKWLDPKTKQNALKKLNKMIHIVGYPDWVDKNDQLNDYYKNYVITSNHFDNAITAVKRSKQRAILDIKKPVDRKEWPEEIGILVANGFYDYIANAIYIPGAILRPPFYNPKRPEAMNYGSIGSFIGHEIGHAFDDEGSQMDEQGALKEWWTKLSREMYTKRILCFKNQYDGYCFNNTKIENNETLCVNGAITLSENVPDNTGLQCAFKAYNKWVKKNAEEKRLVGLDEFNTQQLFFITYAYTWCENMSPEHWFLTYSDDPHSPGRFRVQGPLSNFPDFAQAFQCKPGSMNRDKSICTLW